MAAFSTSAEEAITRTIAVQPDGPHDHLSESDLLEYFEIERTVEELKKGDYKRVALQFPDELLHDSVPIFRLLKARLGAQPELYVLADTSYGSCCVDEVAAQHVDADAMVHYGHACMSQTSRLPVIYVFGRKEIDADDCARRLAEYINAAQRHIETVLLKLEVAYAHAAGEIVSRLQRILTSTKILYSHLPLKAEPVKASATAGPSSEPLEKSSTVDEILYVGGESLSLTNLLMTHSSCEVYSYNPADKSTKIESGKTNKLLMRRYVAVQKARDADVFGILVGTLGVASYLPLISHLRAILNRAQKKSYTISVGKLNPAKLANFLEIECFVIVACPENSVIEAKEFLRPIVTPYELEIALHAKPDWTGRYVLDFNEVLSAEHTNGDTSMNGKDDGSETVDSDQPVFSLMTGKYRHAKRYGGEPQDDATTPSSDSAVTIRNQNTALSVLSDSASAQFLQTRTFRGLETRIGEDAPSVLEQGRSGIARGYADDHRSGDASPGNS
ncbi:putative diphthamide synthesis protein-domain-containing protein [Cristinia sonorae]|uniref:2-(3-amino-3-carboxypropyl)histidine synthase subunit 2 n=1 Tax=Cristinia sonorae TaxID=1940300 RepID=A0A8K0UXA8_9AGAR|nr:putative diphthamide synthesis protein-domain-containing protein [Cristinia sonorae]